MNINYDYLRPVKAVALKELHERSLYEKTELAVSEYSHVTMLPVRYVQDSDGFLFGRGGALASNGSFIEASGIEKRYGLSYDCETPAERNERVMYCGYLSFGWGHFLLESVSRLWPVVSDAVPQVDRYVFIGNEAAGTFIGGNFREFLELLGIYDKVELLDAPARFREVLIPELSYSFLHYYTQQYNGVFDAVISRVKHSHQKHMALGANEDSRDAPRSGNYAASRKQGESKSGAESVSETVSVSSERGRYRKALEEKVNMLPEAAEPIGQSVSPRRLFLSRRHVYDKKHWYGGTRPRERGLDMLDEYFSANGYTIIYPERTSLSELISAMSTAEVIAVESGSCAHNTLLAPRGAAVQIVERQAYVNDYQANIDVIRELNVEYIDAHYSLYPVEPFGGPCLIMNTPQLQSFTKAHGFTPPPAKYDSAAYYRSSIKWYLWLYRHLMGERIMMEETMLPYAAVFKECADDTYAAFRPYLETGRRQFFFRLWERTGYPSF